MYLLNLQNGLSLLLSTIFFVTATCNSGGQTKVALPAISEKVVIENKLPTRRTLRRAFRKKHNFTIVHPDNEHAAAFYQTRVEAMNKREDFIPEVNSIKMSELTKDKLQNDIIFLVGKVENHPLIAELQNKLPVEIKEASFSFNGQEHTDPDAIFKLFPYPNPYNSSLPLYLLIGNDSEVIQQLLQNYYPDDLSDMLRWSWGYEVQQKGEIKISGYFDEQTWEVNKNTHFDFTGQNDTILETVHFQFIVHNSPLTKTAIEQIAKQCEATYTQITDFLERPTNLPKIDYHFYPSVENKAMQKSSMKEASTDFQRNRIQVVMNDNFQGSSQHPENRLIFRSMLGEPKLLALEEGMTNHFTKKWHKKGYNYWTNKLFASDNLPPLTELLDNEVYKRESYLVMGAMAGTFTDFLITHFGKAVFLKNYASWDQIDLISLEKSWLKYLKEKVHKKEIQYTSTKVKLPYLRGFNFAHEGYRIYNGYGSQLAKQSLQRLTEIGSNAIAIVPYSFMRDPKKPSYIPIAQSTGGENDQAVLFAHYEAKKMGMSTMLKPQIWVGRSWPGDIEMKDEKDWATFFQNYYRWTRHYALLAEINELDSYCIGVEFAKATLAKEKEWRQLIQKLRGIYSGQLTYAANWGDEFENLKFWDELDFIGLNCYYPLSKNDNPSKRELRNAFNKILNKVEEISNKYKKPLVFTEIGFRSVDGPWKNPHAKEDGRRFNDAHQKLCYEVVLDGIKNRAWCKGILWWKWPSYMSYRGQQNTGFSPNSKQTESVINEYFKTK